MSDIVQILRRECDHQIVFGNDLSDVLLPAAAEIERLRARVAALEKLRETVESESADAKTLDRDDAILALQLLRRVAQEAAP